MKFGRKWRRRLGSESLETRSLLTTLVISEINFNPYGPFVEFGDADVASTEFEFIEFVNAGDQPVDLQGIRLARVADGDDFQGVDCAFGPGILAAQERTVAVRNLAAFRSRYGEQVPVACEWTGGGLNNQGETITLLDATGGTIVELTYGSNGSWPTRADGMGATLVIRDVDEDPNDAANWRSSPEYGGSPGADSPERLERVLINEVLAHTDLPEVDSVEFHNMTDAPINVSRWYFSDRIGNPFNFAFPPGTVIPADGYLVIDESDFNPGGGTLPTDFLLSERGDQLLLISADINRRPLYIEDYAVLGPTANGVSVGNVSDLRDGVELFPLESLTLGSENEGHRLSDFVISEIQYRPADDDVYKEFIEIMNVSTTPLPLDDWKITEGLESSVPAGTELAPGEVIVLVAFNPNDAVRAAAFREYYEIDSAVRLVGPWSADNNGNPDALSNGGERIILRSPMDDVDLIVYAVADQVNFNDRVPWPEVADGQGGSLSRVTSESYGNLATSWQGTRPSPGNQPPNLDASPEISVDQSIADEIGRDGLIERGNADIDIYRFQPATAGSFQIRAESNLIDGADTFLRLFAADGEELAFNDNHLATISSQVEVQLDADVDYFIVVSGNSDDPRAYDPFSGTGLVEGDRGGYVLTVREIEDNSHPWHNANFPEDVNADGDVVPLDVLLVINELNRTGGGPLVAPSSPPTEFIDVEPDNYLSPIDALLVINYLNTLTTVETNVVAAVAKSVDRASSSFETSNVATPPAASSRADTTDATFQALAGLSAADLDSWRDSWLDSKKSKRVLG